MEGVLEVPGCGWEVNLLEVDVPASGSAVRNFGSGGLGGFVAVGVGPSRNCIGVAGTGRSGAREREAELVSAVESRKDDGVIGTGRTGGNGGGTDKRSELFHEPEMTNVGGDVTVPSVALTEPVTEVSLETAVGPSSRPEASGWPSADSS